MLATCTLSQAAQEAEEQELHKAKQRRANLGGIQWEEGEEFMAPPNMLARGGEALAAAERRAKTKMEVGDAAAAAKAGRAGRTGSAKATTTKRGTAKTANGGTKKKKKAAAAGSDVSGVGKDMRPAAAALAASVTKQQARSSSGGAGPRGR